MKKFLAGLLAAAMVFSLTGCGPKEPTADELVAGVKAVDGSKYTSMSVSLELAYPDGGDVDGLSVEGDVEAAGSVVHIDDMTMKVEADGFSMSIGLAAWIDGDKHEGYMDMSLFGEKTGWSKADIEDDTGVDPSKLDMSELAGKLTDGATLELQERDKKSKDDYVVRWTMDPAALAEMVDKINQDDDADADIKSAEGSMRFDYGTRQLKGVSVACDMEVDGERASFDLVADINELNADKTLSVPEDVIKEAETNGDGTGGLDGIFGGGDDPVDPGFGAGGGEPLDPGFGVGTETPGPGGSTGYAGYDNLQVDGSGSDELMDGLGTFLADYDPMGSIYVHHYDGYSTLSWYPATGDDWSGSINLTHYTVMNEYADPKRDFEDGVDFLAGYLGVDPTYGGKDESDAVFITDGNGARNLEYVSYSDNGLYIESTVHSYTEETDDEIMEHLLYIVGVVGGYQG